MNWKPPEFKPLTGIRRESSIPLQQLPQLPSRRERRYTENFSAISEVERDDVVRALVSTRVPIVDVLDGYDAWLRVDLLLLALGRCGQEIWSRTPTTRETFVARAKELSNVLVKELAKPQ